MNSLKIKWIQRLLNPIYTLWRNLLLYQLNLVRNYKQGLALFTQKQMLRSTTRKHLQKQNYEDFFIQLLNTWLHFTNNNFFAHTSVKEILDQTYIFKCTVQTDNLFSIASHPGIFQTNLLLFITDLCRCLQSCPIPSATFGEKLVFTGANHKRKYKFLRTKFLMIPNTYFKLKSPKRKIPFKALYTYKGTGKEEEEFQKLSNKEIYFTLQSNSTK